MRSLSIPILLALSAPAFAQEPPPAEAPPAAEEPPPAEPAPTPVPEPEPAVEATTSAAADGGVYAAGTMGLQFAVPSGGAPTAGITYFISPDAAMRLDIGFLYSTQEDPATGNSTDAWGFSIEAGYRMYRLALGRLRPFIQPTLFVSKAAVPVPEGTDGPSFGELLTVAVTGGFGVEYMFWDRFSIGGQTGLALVFSNEFNDISFSTGTSALFAAFYF